jgi:hypothetical protein
MSSENFKYLCVKMFLLNYDEKQASSFHTISFMIVLWSIND